MIRQIQYPWWHQFMFLTAVILLMACVPSSLMLWAFLVDHHYLKLWQALGFAGGLLAAEVLFAGVLIVSAQLLYSYKLRLSQPEAFQPRPAFECPRCQSEQIRVRSSGLWDGEDQHGNWVGGIFEYGLCQKCGSRCVRYVDDHPFIPTDEDWDRHFRPQEELGSRQKSWPFDSL